MKWLIIPVTVATAGVIGGYILVQVIGRAILRQQHESSGGDMAIVRAITGGCAWCMDGQGGCSCTARCSVRGCRGLKLSATRWTAHDVPILYGNLDSLREDWWTE